MSNKNKVKIGIAVVVVIALAVITILILRNPSPANPVETPSLTVDEVADNLQGYLPGYTKGEIADILNSEFTEEQQNTLDSINEEFRQPEFVEAWADPNDPDVIHFIDSEGNEGTANYNGDTGINFAELTDDEATEIINDSFSRLEALVAAMQEAEANGEEYTGQGTAGIGGTGGTGGSKTPNISNQPGVNAGSAGGNSDDTVGIKDTDEFGDVWDDYDGAAGDRDHFVGDYLPGVDY